ncbi:MAG: tryptophan synthase subunit alpha [Candidatus Bathyarchaeia archaeon]
MLGTLRETLKGRALMAYLTAGDPYVDWETINILSEGGVDIFEFGIPMAKPKYDGLTIKASYKRALEGGATLEKSFNIIKEFKLSHKIVFTYFEYAESVGLEKFVDYSKNAGAEGVLFPDLLIDYPEELDTYIRYCNKYGFSPIFFVTSSFPHNLISRLAQLDPAFIYLGVMASTGTLLPISISRNIRIVKNLIADTPLFVGFAISEPLQVMDCVRAGASGVVVGSAIIRLISQKKVKTVIREDLKNYVVSLKSALKV